jgi:hypothetical protein
MVIEELLHTVEGTGHNILPLIHTSFVLHIVKR